jgi:hypothetical protein
VHTYYTREYKNIKASGEEKYLKKIFTALLLTTSIITVFPKNDSKLLITAFI